MSDAHVPNPPGSESAEGGAREAEGPRMPSSQPILLKALRWGLAATAALAVVFAGLGWLVSDIPGLVGGIIGAGLGGVFLAMTVGSIVFANRFVASEVFVGVFFAIVLGAWLLKFVAFIAAILLLRDQPWLDSTMLFLGLIASVMMSLAIDVLVVVKSRMPYVSDPAS